MGFFDRFRNKENIAEPKTTANSTDLPNHFMPIPRADGTTIYISQLKDKMGYPCYEQIGNKCIPKFNVIAPELEQISQKGNITRVHTILIDFPDIHDVLRLNDPYYMSQIANVLLNSNRMQKIVTQYHNYAGGLNLDQNGIVIGKFVDQNVVNYLRMDKEARNAKYQAEYQNSEKQAQAQRTAAAARQAEEQYIKNYNPSSPEAELLNPDMLNNGRSHTVPDGYDR